MFLFESASGKPLEICHNQIHEAEKKIQFWIDNVPKMQDDSTSEFGRQTEKIFEIIGPEAAKFVDEISKLNHKLNELHINKTKIYNSFSRLRGMWIVLFKFKSFENKNSWKSTPNDS